MKFVSLTCFLLLNAGSLTAQDDSILFYTDEDINPILQFADANDQNYTMGLGFGYASPKLNRSYLLKPVELLNSIFIPNSFLTIDQSLPAILTINGTAFTPDDLREIKVINYDRPYAFLLYLSSKKMYMKGNSMFSTEFNFGIIGLDIGKWVQTGIHKLMNDNNTREPYIPEGWHNQISKGGEPTLLYAVSYERLLMQNSFFEFKSGAQAMVGYYTCTSLQATARLGWLDNSKWSQNYTPLGSGNKNTSKNKIANQKQFECFLFGSLKPTGFVYNHMLNGGFRNSSHTLSWNQINHVILEWNSGIGISIPTSKTTSFDLIWALNAGRTSEINTPLSRNHQWGGIYLSYVY